MIYTGTVLHNNRMVALYDVHKKLTIRFYNVLI